LYQLYHLYQNHCPASFPASLEYRSRPLGFGSLPRRRIPSQHLTLVSPSGPSSFGYVCFVYTLSCYALYLFFPVYSLSLLSCLAARGHVTGTSAIKIVNPMTSEKHRIPSIVGETSSEEPSGSVGLKKGAVNNIAYESAARKFLLGEAARLHSPNPRWFM